jgi:hypothetical protein
MKKDQSSFGTSDLQRLREIANELEDQTCKQVLRHILQGNMEIERYPQAFRERFDIAFSQAVSHYNACEQWPLISSFFS